MLKNRCETQCQHPHCWFINDKHNDGFTKEPIQPKCYTSFDKTNLSTQSIKNLLSDYGVCDGISNPHNNIRKLPCQSLSQEIIKSKSRYNPTIVFCDELERIDASCAHHVNRLNIFNTDEIQFERVNTVSAKQYVWVPNPNETQKHLYRNMRSKDDAFSSSAANLRVTKLVLPLEEFHLKAGKQKEKIHLPLHTRSLYRIKDASHNVLEQNSLSKDKSCVDFVNSEGMLPQRQLIFQIPVNYSDKSQLVLSSPIVHQKYLKLLVNQEDSSKQPSSSLNLLECKQDLEEPTKINDSIRSNKNTTLQPINKIPAISLGLPELPSGVKITKPFTYKKLDLNFTLGPTLSALSSQRSNGKENTTRGTGNTLQQNETTEKETYALGSPQQPISVLIPDPSIQCEFPEKRTSLKRKDHNQCTINKTIDYRSKEHTEQQRSATDLETLSTCISSNRNISPDKMLETETLSMVTVRPNSVETSSTSAWPLITETIVDQNVTRTISKTHLKSRRSSKQSKKVNGEIETRSHPLEILKVEKCKVKSPAPPPPSPELRKHALLISGLHGGSN